MSDKQFYHNIDGLGVVELKGVRVHNIADATAQTTFETTGNYGAALGVANTGLQIYRVDLQQVAFWDGTQFVFQAVTIDGDVIFKGLIDASVAIDDAGQPQVVEPVAGYQYVVSVAGTFDAGATGVTLQGNQALEVGDIVLFTSATEAYAIQRNDVYATETVEGNIRLATQAEVTAGTVADEAVTPATLQGKLDAQFYAKQYTETLDLTGANTPDTVTHSLGLVNKDAFTVNIMNSAGSAISVDVDSVDVNSLTLTSLLPLTNVVITVVGASAV